MLVALEARALPEQTAGACTVVLITHGPVSRTFRMPASLSCSPARTPTSSIKARRLIARSQAVSSPHRDPGSIRESRPGLHDSTMELTGCKVPRNAGPRRLRYSPLVGWCNGNTSGPYPGECGFDSRPCMQTLTGFRSRSPAGARSVPVVGMPSTNDRAPSRGCNSDGGLLFRAGVA